MILRTCGTTLSFYFSWADGERTKRPIIFIAHSLGGIICKTALLYSEGARAWEMKAARSVAESTLGIMFFGTPRMGSPQAQWATILLSAVSNVREVNAGLVAQLHKDNPDLLDLQDKFYGFLSYRKECRRPIAVGCCYEQRPLVGAGEIVPYASAKMVGYSEIPIPSDHRDMVKFPDKAFVGYDRVLSSLKAWTKMDRQASEAGEQDQSSPRGRGTVIQGGAVTGGVHGTFSGGSAGSVFGITIRGPKQGHLDIKGVLDLEVVLGKATEHWTFKAGIVRMLLETQGTRKLAVMVNLNVTSCRVVHEVVSAAARHRQRYEDPSCFSIMMMVVVVTMTVIVNVV
ncbi:uncharacterized protein Z519_05909 [Cladophialophora bantiana CBS 173.52]|uniref:DUF676 domain-containing protein n=1 Tax=Cladophialophora bantiana (strain ATCC 10958 / CBS 173.52 / CDC B-1940 / NIH 8579) TaxID=1442370 RepID=A0A0D2I951_CLAB1|nr:uncharacterized protein Z519_05909 [Cladophialophora bantiana CBS 173.52]KIW93304.1 hypothetical protein Z519_05909 [Cladophialophora bantiana CBS 173.52]